MNKYFLLSILLLLLSNGLLTAQTNKGKVLVGVSSAVRLAGTGSDIMSIGFTSVKQKSDASGYDEPDPDKTTSINFLPKVGYFVVDNFAVGLDISTSFSNSKDGEDNYKYSQKLFSAGPFVRYYIPTSKVFTFFELSSSFGSIKSKVESDYDDNDSKTSVMSFGAGIGLAAPLGERVTFDALIGYNSLTAKEKEDNPDNDRTVISSLGLKLGFTVLF